MVGHFIAVLGRFELLATLRFFVDLLSHFHWCVDSLGECVLANSSVAGRFFTDCSTTTLAFRAFCILTNRSARLVMSFDVVTCYPRNSNFTGS